MFPNAQPGPGSLISEPVRHGSRTYLIRLAFDAYHMTLCLCSYSKRTW